MGRPLKGSRAQARRLLLAAADPEIGFAMREMPLAIFCSWLSFQRVPCETPDSRPPTASRRMTIATLQRITFVQPPLGCDDCRPRRRRSGAFRTASIAGDQHSWAVPASRFGSCFHLRLRRLHPGRVAASGEGRGLPHVPVARFFRGQALMKQIRCSARALSARVERSVSRYGRPLSPPPSELLPALRAAARTPLPTTHHVAVLGAQSTFRR